MATPELDKVYMGRVERITDFGAFIEEPTTRPTPVVVMTAAVAIVIAARVAVARAGSVDGGLQVQSALHKPGRATQTGSRADWF